MEEGLKKVYEPEGRDKDCKILSSGHDIDIIVMTSTAAVIVYNGPTTSQDLTPNDHS